MPLRGRHRRSPSVLEDADGARIVLHVGCGPADPEMVPGRFRGPDWRELRLDIDPAVQPDIVGSIVDMSMVPPESVDAVWASHNLEHVYAHEVPTVLREFFRVLRSDGQAVILVPDLQTLADLIATGNLEGVAFRTQVGAISPLDVVYGFGSAIAAGNEYMAHRTGFTAKTLADKLREAGFVGVDVTRQEVALLLAVAYKRSAGRVPVRR